MEMIESVNSESTSILYSVSSMCINTLIVSGGLSDCLDCGKARTLGHNVALFGLERTLPF